MKCVFVTTNSAAENVNLLAPKLGRFDKVAVQDELNWAAQLIGLLTTKEYPTRTSIWTAHPDDTSRLMNFGAEQIILQGEDNQADAVAVNVIALRDAGFTGLISVVTNMWPSREVSWFDKFMHKNAVRLLPECYLPDNANLTPLAMITEAHGRGYPSAQPVLGCYRGMGLAQYAPLPKDYWIWDYAQMPASDFP